MNGIFPLLSHIKIDYIKIKNTHSSEHTIKRLKINLLAGKDNYNMYIQQSTQISERRQNTQLQIVKNSRKDTSKIFKKRTLKEELNT